MVGSSNWCVVGSVWSCVDWSSGVGLVGWVSVGVVVGGSYWSMVDWGMVGDWSNWCVVGGVWGGGVWGISTVVWVDGRDGHSQDQKGSLKEENSV